MMTLTYAARTCSKLVYRASQFEADAQIGRLLDTLDKRGLSDNTMVIFSGVNTLHVSSLRRCSLCSLFSLCLPLRPCAIFPACTPMCGNTTVICLLRQQCIGSTGALLLPLGQRP